MVSRKIINDRYVLSASPNSGGMADVYRARDLEDEDEKKVAVKLFKYGEIENEIIEESFKRETEALKDLKHPGIVELLDSGQDEKTGQYFLVLEWMEKDLTALLQESPPAGWDEFWPVVGLPVLEALAFSHERQCVHRDIKPSNILVSTEGKVKLADFGISKLKSYLQPSVTLREFGSRPFTPPEEDDGSYTYTRDVFSFGVLVLKCLTDVKLGSYEDIPRAIATFQAPEEIVNIIERAVCRDDPLERQHNAEVLLAELKGAQKPQLDSTRRRPCYLEATSKCLERLQDELGLYSDAEAREIILDDLNNECGSGIGPYKLKDESDNREDHYEIYGFSYRYHVKIDEGQRNRLVIFSARSDSYSQLERRRDRSWIAPYEFTFARPLNSYAATEVIEELEDAVAEHEANLREKQEEEQKQRPFRVWNDLLRAKLDWEEQRESPIKYESYDYDGNRVFFEISSLPENDVVEQPRHVTAANGYSLLGGEVKEVKGDRLTLYIQHGDPDRIPKSGELRFDIRAAEVAINRQKAAVDAIQFDRGVRSDLRDLLVNPQQARPPQLIENLQFIDEKLNSSQQLVVEAALGTQDFLIVEGPPGTGKTTFITEVILQTIRQKPDARILLSSQTHLALDNALEKIQAKNPELKLLRIGNRDRVSAKVSSLLLEEQMNRWREEVRQRAKQFISDWSAQRGISPDDSKIAELFQQLSQRARKLEMLKEEIEIWKQDLDEIFAASYDLENPESMSRENIPLDRLEEVDSIEAEIARLRKDAKKGRGARKEIAKELQQLSEIESEELIKMPPGELEGFAELLIEDKERPEVKMLQRLASIQADWFEQFGRNQAFNAPLLKRSQLVAGTCIGIPREIQDIEFDLCIVDEASKATATEVLVPLVRSRRWILVGDRQQLPPFQDEASRDADFLKKYDLDRDEIKQTLFDRLFEALPEANRKMLTIQHRMVAAIGDLIGECFYDGKLESARQDIDSELSTVLPKPVTWLTTTKLRDNREKPANSSFNNPCEANAIVQLLEELNEMADVFDKNYSIAVLTGYAAQLKLLEKRLARESKKWQNLTVECNTVDAFQGREADIAVYSVTRSNKKGEIGFLRATERLNVALSRGKVGLVIVGDHHFCRTSGKHPLSKVLDYIESHRQNCILKEAN
jgi:superfamily I DNA and/or RNA helicase/serine/threonine protein kinase